jgi:CDP-glucose 4,6-dehydratase
MAKNWEDVRWKDTSTKVNSINEAGLLKLNCDKALADLSWSPTLKFDETVQLTVDWYKAFYSKENQSKESEMLDFTENQIKIYTDLANKRKVKWAL